MDCDTKCSESSTNTKAEVNVYGHIDTKGLATLVAAGALVVILDARSDKWDDGKRIATAQALSYEASAADAAKVIPHKESLIVVYCSNSRCSASTHLAIRLTELGYSNILKYEEGIQEWLSCGHPVRGCC